MDYLGVSRLGRVAGQDNESMAISCLKIIVTTK